MKEMKVGRRGGREEERWVGWGIRGAYPVPQRSYTASARQLGLGSCRCSIVSTHLYTVTETHAAASQPLSTGKRSSIHCASLRYCNTVTDHRPCKREFCELSDLTSGNFDQGRRCIPY